MYLFRFFAPTPCAFVFSDLDSSLPFDWKLSLFPRSKHVGGPSFGLEGLLPDPIKVSFVGWHRLLFRALPLRQNVMLLVPDGIFESGEVLRSGVFLAGDEGREDIWLSVALKLKLVLWKVLTMGVGIELILLKLLDLLVDNL